MFLSHTKSAFLGGDNVGVSPSYFEWEPCSPQAARFVTDSDIKHAKGEGQIAWLLEPFHLHPENYIEAMNKPFDYVLTSNLYFAQNNPNWLWCAHGGSWINFDWHKLYKKTGNISMLMSDKDTMPGHKLRHEIAERFGNKIDVRSGVSAFEGYAPYKYSIIVENERAEGYFTEKLIDCFSVGTIPIYFGCKNIDEYFEDHGVIRFRDLYNLDVIIDQIEVFTVLDHWLDDNLKLSREYRIVEDWIYNNYPYLFQ